MKRREWMGYAAAALFAGAFLAGCGNIRKLAKSDPEPEVGVYLPAQSKREVAARAADTARGPRIITFRKQDGTELFLTPVAVDSASGEKMMSVAIDEVVISAANRRNLVERNGKINVDFIVSVPQSLQDRDWQLVLDPQLLKGEDTLTFDPLVYSGERFRTMQQREYGRYDDYVDRIVDSADYFDRFGDKGAYRRYMTHVADERAKYGDASARLERLTPDEAMYDERVGWTTPRERNRQYESLRRYVYATDRKVKANTTYTPDPEDKFDHLNDYLAPRYRYEGIDVLPGGEIYTRIEGDYPEEGGRAREAYIRSLTEQPGRVYGEVYVADGPRLHKLAGERLAYTGRRRSAITELLAETSDSATLENYRMRKTDAESRLATLNSLDTAAVRNSVLRQGQVARNRRLEAGKPAAFERLVRHPYYMDARLDTVIYRPDGKVDYYYTEQVQADENTSKLRLYLTGGVEDRSGRTYRLTRSDTLTYNVASMTTFLDERTRYMQRIVLRDAEANARFFFTFPVGKSSLVDTLTENRRQIAAVRSLTRGLMTDPVYIIDSITLRATASPEGTWALNERLARDRAEALRRVLVSEFRVLYDSLSVTGSYTLDEQGRQVVDEADEKLPDLPNLLRSTWLAEDWDELYRLVSADTLITHKSEILEMIRWEGNPDTREWRIRLKYPKEYARMRSVIYPQMRAVDFRFNLHRRGMKQDTVWTTEVDSNYMHAVDLLRKRRYEEALTILRPYEDCNTALAYMSLGYDAAAYRILKAQPGAASTADIQYMLAILAARLGDEEQAVRYFLHSVELRENLKFRGNLDPEISRLIRKYGLFREDFE
ncbi:MAG TPA: hypothetical protein H9828_00045 [Candidatus Alistipes intestinigallinarum]|uniref:Tetratricopeptide repeat protein n=1 Tax=Candidatus Alistipes intestinigallinarum TaxID=2838440 RepID=A0A9D2CBC4_9BACT|nr:hypothetical protein [Candidatus Alistipes intestinigallinarum]